MVAVVVWSAARDLDTRKRRRGCWGPKIRWPGTCSICRKRQVREARQASPISAILPIEAGVLSMLALRVHGTKFMIAFECIHLGSVARRPLLLLYL